MTVGIDDGERAAAPSDEELAEYEQERPARRLRPALDLVLSVWCAIVSVGVLAQVFFPLPQGTQFYLVIFLAAVLPMTLLCYRGIPGRRGTHDDPGILDWALALVALAVVSTAPGLRRVPGASSGSHYVGRGGRCPLAGASTRGLSSYDGLGLAGVQPGLHCVRLLRRVLAVHVGARAPRLQLRRDHRPAHDGYGGLLRDPVERGRVVHRALHHLRRGARLLGRGQVLHQPVVRGVQAQSYGAGPDRHAGRIPARHRVGIR
ncbi:hypothetical protein JOF29_005833 [Kribbella aluminosa]|uniref:Uncharacterized protein n=1 Tax=Kribbella aluminosa TaxID=416017 RepID=A0ABS4USX3_9ACTN|nr:hypothetical protein [Kribbella aluminosa]